MICTREIRDRTVSPRVSIHREMRLVNVPTEHDESEKDVILICFREFYDGYLIFGLDIAMLDRKKERTWQESVSAG